MFFICKVCYSHKIYGSEDLKEKRQIEIAIVYSMHVHYIYCIYIYS